MVSTDATDIRNPSKTCQFEILVKNLIIIIFNLSNKSVIPQK